MVQVPPEKLGSFFIGAKYDQTAREMGTEPVNYDARDLTTHAVCVGMTGSGKTGLCIGLLEEAAIDKVPAIIIDPKGDMTNLLLQFEDLEADDFQPWINADDAGRKGMSVEEYAAGTADKWKNGLASWGQDSARIQNLKDSVEYTIYTPGSDSGVPVNIMGSFAAPGVDFESETEMLRERIQGTVAALLGMINSKADPVRSREGILLASLFEHHWRKNDDLDLAGIIRGVQKPPFTQLGVFDVDTFFPSKDRFDLAMEFNTLMASPQFSYWLKGDSLDIEKMYYTPEGKPRHSIFYVAHLSDSERMFFVTLLLNSLITWMRRQSGTTSLRSLLYFDEIFGYFPPTAEPPSKKPLLTILKQARAFGVGAVLVTQNPVDIDYKGLSNAGTWFIGKLQTERDKMRVLQGLEGAIAEAGGKAATDFSQLISSLSSRVFLLHNVHEEQPVVFHTRWVMSYLRGPMTRPQVRQLMAVRKEMKKQPKDEAVAAAEPMATSFQEPVVEQAVQEATPPSVDPSVNQRYFSVWKSMSEARSQLGTEQDCRLIYEPLVLTWGKLRFYDNKRKVDEVKSVAFVSNPPDEFGRTNWLKSQKIKNWEKALVTQPDYPKGVEASFASLPATAKNAKDLKKVQKDLSNWLYERERHVIHEHADHDLFQKSGESVESFRMRVQQFARELRDDELDEVQERYEPKFERINDRIRKEEHELEDAKDDLKHRKRAEWVGMAETVFSVFVKRRKRSVSAATSKARMRSKAKSKVEASEDDLLDLREDFIQLQEELDSKLTDVRTKWESIADGISKREIKPRRADVKIDGVILSWLPFWVANTGKRVSALK